MHFDDPLGCNFRSFFRRFPFHSSTVFFHRFAIESFNIDITSGTSLAHARRQIPIHNTNALRAARTIGFVHIKLSSCLSLDAFTRFHLKTLAFTIRDHHRHRRRRRRRIPMIHRFSQTEWCTHLFSVYTVHCTGTLPMLIKLIYFSFYDRCSWYRAHRCIRIVFHILRWWMCLCNRYTPPINIIQCSTNIVHSTYGWRLWQWCECQSCS